MSHLTDARDILFADPADMDTASYVSDVSLNDQIEARRVARSKPPSITSTPALDDAEIEHAAFYLKCAIARDERLVRETRSPRSLKVSKVSMTENWVLAFPVTSRQHRINRTRQLAEGDASHGLNNALLKCKPRLRHLLRHRKPPLRYITPRRASAKGWKDTGCSLSLKPNWYQHSPAHRWTLHNASWTRLRETSSRWQARPVRSLRK